MSALLKFAHAMDWISQRLGHIASWTVLLAAMISAGNAFIRYGLDISSNAWLEIQWYMFAVTVMLGAPLVLKLNEHVRVDLFYGSASARRKLWIDVIGIIFFLFPSTIMIGAMAWPFFLSSFQSGEMSSNAGGLPVWPVKFLLPFGMALVFLQGLAELIKRIAALRGEYAVAVEYERPLQ